MSEKLFGEEKPSLDDIQHYGTKGMQWGVRKRNPKSSEIRSARQRQDQKLRELQRQDDIASTSSGRTRSAAVGKARKLARDLQTNEDRVTAARLTSGEKVTAALLAGPIGLVIIGANRANVRSIARETDSFRARV